jgi:hypothetical protein
MRRGDLGAVTTKVTEAKVIGKNQQKIGARRGLQGAEVDNQQGKQRGEGYG